jgi:hypothetical protein
MNADKAAAAAAADLVMAPKRSASSAAVQVLALASVYGSRQDEPARRAHEATLRRRAVLGLPTDGIHVENGPKAWTAEYKAAAARIRAENTARRMLEIAKRQPHNTNNKE